MKITCTEDIKNKLIENNNFPSKDLCECYEMMGISKDECACISCQRCKSKNIEWEIEPKSESEKKKDLTIREIAEAFVNCEGTRCSECIFGETDDCKEDGGKMILRQLDKETVACDDAPKPITWDEIQTMLGEKIYLRCKNGEIDEVIPVKITEKDDEKFVTLYDIKRDFTTKFYYETPDSIIASMKLYSKNPED